MLIVLAVVIAMSVVIVFAVLMRSVTGQSQRDRPRGDRGDLFLDSGGGDGGGH